MPKRRPSLVETYQRMVAARARKVKAMPRGSLSLPNPWLWHRPHKPTPRELGVEPAPVKQTTKARLHRKRLARR